MTNIVMLVKDRLELTAQALWSLYRHTAEGQFNLTVVNDGSQDFRVIKLLYTYSLKANCCVLHLHGSNGVLSQNKNLGVAASRELFGAGDWLYLSDNDVYFTSGWLDKLTKDAGAAVWDGYALWGGQVHPFHKPEIQDGCIVYPVLDGPSWLMRWPTWDFFGPFKRDTAPGVCQSEEYPFCSSVIEAGHKIGVTVPHVVIHTGLTNSDGKPAPGYEQRKAAAIPGVLYI